MSLETQSAGVPASETSSPTALCTSDSDTWVNFNSENENSELENAESADPAPFRALNTRDGVAKRPSHRRRGIYRKASRRVLKCRRVNCSSTSASTNSSRCSALNTPVSDGADSDASGLHDAQSDGSQTDNAELDDDEDSELNIRAVDVSRLHIPRLDINGLVIPHDLESDGSPLQGPPTNSNLPDHPEDLVLVRVEAPRRNFPLFRIDGYRLVLRLEPAANDPHHNDAAEANNQAGLPEGDLAEASWPARKLVRFRDFFNNELPTWPADWQVLLYTVVVFCYILLCEFLIVMTVVLTVGAYNIIQRMGSGPRAVSRQILEDIPFAYLCYIPILFSISIVLEGFVMWYLGPPEAHRRRCFSTLYLHLQSARLWMPIFNTLLDLYTAISVLNCVLLGYRLLIAR